MMQLDEAAFYDVTEGNNYAEARYLFYYLQEHALLHPDFQALGFLVSFCVLRTHPICDALGDHDARQIGVGAWDRRHDRSVDDAQVVDAAHTAARVDDRA